MAKKTSFNSESPIFTYVLRGGITVEANVPFNFDANGKVIETHTGRINYQILSNISFNSNDIVVTSTPLNE